MNHRLPCLLTALFLAALPLSAQQQRDGGKEKEVQDRLGFAKSSTGESKGCCADRWTCIIDSPDKAVTMVKLSAITSISKQTYLLEGTQKITEVTIDTLGNNSIRFYCMSSERTNRMADRLSNARDIVNKHTESASELPAKKYPEATHSHNIEYRLSTPEQVNRIYESATHAWAKNISSRLRIKG